MARNTAKHKPSVAARRADRTPDVRRSKGHGTGVGRSAQPGAKQRPKRIDWAAAKTDYVSHVQYTLDDIAAKYGVRPTAVYQQAHRGNWTEARAQRSQLLAEKVIQKSVLNAVEELARYNEQDLEIAKALRTVAALRITPEMQMKLDAREIRALAGAIESTQRVARLALGASTENADTRISEADRMTPEERRERLRQLHAQLFPTVQ